MSLEKAREIISRIEDLPTVPEVVIGITRLIDDPNATAEDIYRAVSTDPSLSATMLKLVNSAFYGMSRSVTSLEQAIKILGFVTVRDIALAAFVFDAFMTGRGGFDYRSFWLHSIGTGAAANLLARRLRIKESSEYFVHGLLHDLGVIVMMQCMIDDFDNISKEARAGKPLADCESETIGCTHNELGAALAESWDFPPAIVATMRYHSGPGLPEEFRREVAVTSCAGTISVALEIGDNVTGHIGTAPREIWEEAGVKPDDLGDILDELLLEMDNSRTFVDLLFS